MRRIRRLTALVANLLLLQLVLVGSGIAGACTDHGPPMPGVAASVHHHGGGSGMAVHHASDAGHGTAGCDVPSERAGGAPCGLPWAPGGCATVASCGAPMVTTTATATELMLAAARIDGEPAVAPSGPAAPPELPPPRT